VLSRAGRDPPSAMTRGADAPQAQPADISHMLQLAHAFGVYPVALKDSVISLGDDAFLFCVGRQLALYDHVTQKLSFLNRDARNRIVTAASRSANSSLLAVAERVGGDGPEGFAQISMMALPRINSGDKGAADSSGSTELGTEKVIKVITPQNKRLDIIGVAFASADGKFLVSLSDMPDCTITYWRWEVDKAMAMHDCKPQLPLTRLQINPHNQNQFSISGPKYMKIWEYSVNDANLKECVSMYPGANQEKQMDIVDHCWVLGVFLVAATSDGKVHLFEDGEFKKEIDVREIITKDEAKGAKAKEKEQAKALGLSLKTPPPVRLTSIAAWGRGFVVGGDQGYLGVFKVSAQMAVEPFGTFRMPGEDATIWHMCAGSEDTQLTILSFQEKEAEEAEGGSGAPRGASKAPSGGRLGTKGGMASSATSIVQATQKEKLWSLTTFPVSQADLADTGQLEVFQPVFALGTHNGPVLSMSAGGSRRIVATTGSDMTLKIWGYPAEDGRNEGATAFTSELSIKVSDYEKPKSVALHPLGFQAAVILDDMVRIYHLGTQQVTRTLYDLPLKKPSHCAFSNSGNMLAVTSEHDVILFDPWRSTLIHVFGGRGGHLSTVNQVLFAEDDRTLLSCAGAPAGAIYGWDLESENKERCFEHISKSNSFNSMAFDFRRKLAVTTVKDEGGIRVCGHLNETLLDIPAESSKNKYTVLQLCAPLSLLFAGTQQGSVRVFKWPIVDSGAAANPFMEFPIHAHSVTSLTLSQDSRLLFSACAGGAVIACKLESREEVHQATAPQLLQRYVKYRHRTDGADKLDTKKKQNRDEAKKIGDLQRKMTEAVQGMSTSVATLDELVLIPRVFFNERLSEIKELEERMASLRHESDCALEQREQDTAAKMSTIQGERAREKKKGDDKYDALFAQLKKANERHQESMGQANSQFDGRTRHLQTDFEDKLSKEYEKQSRLLNELQTTRDSHDGDVQAIEGKHGDQVTDMRGAQEKAIRDWRSQYDMVCNLLKSDGLKFEEALKQQEGEYEGQISEILEHKRVSLQVESEKSTTALKDGVSMRQTISMLHRQLKAKDDEVHKMCTDKDDVQKQLEASQEMFAKVEVKVKELERGLKVKDESLSKLREQMKHLESFRFVLFHKVRALEEERDPLEQQVGSLKTSVREMYSEFVKQFRKKQDVDQQLTVNIKNAKSLQDENVAMRGTLVQLKKDARRMIQDTEQILHAETQDEFKAMPKRLMDVIDKHKKLAHWAPPTEDDENSKKTDDDLQQESALIQEMVVQRDLLFRKNQIAVGQASQAKRECTQDFRRLTSENAQLIAEMNMLRTENRSFQRSHKEMECQLMNLRQEMGKKGGVGSADTAAMSGGAGSGGGLGRNASAPDLGGKSKSARGGITPMGANNPEAASTPYIRKKVVDQQELYRRQKQKSQNQLPPVAERAGGLSAGMSAATRLKPSVEERRFASTLDTVANGREHHEKQGFNLGRLTSQAAEMTGYYNGAELGQGSPVAGGAEQVEAGPGAGAPPA